MMVPPVIPRAWIGERSEDPGGDAESSSGLADRGREGRRQTLRNRLSATGNEPRYFSVSGEPLVVVPARRPIKPPYIRQFLLLIDSIISSIGSSIGGAA